MKAAVIVFPGINRERDMARTLKLVSGRAPAMVWHADTALPAGSDLANLVQERTCRIGQVLKVLKRLDR